jgi:hypothetical protein
MSREKKEKKYLPPEPTHLEKYSSFTSSSSPQALLQYIAQVLTGENFKLLFVFLGCLV